VRGGCPLLNTTILPPPILSRKTTRVFFNTPSDSPHAKLSLSVAHEIIQKKRNSVLTTYTYIRRLHLDFKHQTRREKMTKEATNELPRKVLYVAEDGTERIGKLIFIIDEKENPAFPYIVLSRQNYPVAVKTVIERSEV
jgi:hypothetical protein